MSGWVGKLGSDAISASYPVRSNTIRFPIDAGPTIVAHPGPKKRPRYASAVAMDISGDGARASGHSERPCRPKLGSRYTRRALGRLFTSTGLLNSKLTCLGQEITLTTSTDPFFQTHFLDTFGDLGTSLKDYVQAYQSRSLAQSPSSINSISDMKRFVEEYPEFRKLGGNVSKHVALVGELSRLVSRDKLLEVGEVEQGLATSAGAELRVGPTLSVPRARINS